MKSIQFFKGLSWLIILNLLIKPVWIFFIDRQVQIAVGYEEYGKYFAVLNLSYVLFFLSDAGLSNMLNQKVANGVTLNVRQLLRVKFSLLASYAIVCFFIGWLTHISDWNILFYVVMIQVLTSLFIFLRGMVTANQFFTVDAWFSVIDKLLMVLVCGSILYTSFFGGITLRLFLQIQLISTGMAVLISMIFILQKSLILSGKKDNVERIIKQIAPFAVCVLLMSVHYRLDGFLLERIHANGALEAGIYASAYRLLDASNMVGYLTVSFLVPFIARHEKEKEVVEETVLNSRHGLLFFSLGVACFCIMYAQWIERTLYHSDNSYNAKVIGLCVAALPAYCLVHIYGSMLSATARFKPFIQILILSVVLNIILNLFLIPSQGALGCCIAALVSQYFCGVACCIVSTRTFSISFDLRSVMIYLLSIGLLLSIFYFGKTAVVNVWVILLIAIGVSLFLLITQISFLKKYFISLR